MSSKFFTRFTSRRCPAVKAVGGLTQQHFKDECDLNTILKRFRVTGLPPPPQVSYQDLTVLPTSLDEAFDCVQNAVDWFSNLPSDVREKFGNDPRNALRLLNSDPKAAAAAGLLPSQALPEPILAKAAEAATPEPQKKAAEVAPATVEESGEK